MKIKSKITLRRASRGQAPSFFRRPPAGEAFVGLKLLLGLDQVIAPAGVPRARSSVFVGPSSMALQGELSESLLLPHEITKVNKAYRSHAGPTKNFRDSRLRLPPHGQRLYLSAIGLPSSRLRGVRHIRHVCELGLRPPPLRQARAARGKGAEAPSACCMSARITLHYSL